MQEGEQQTLRGRAPGYEGAWGGRPDHQSHHLSQSSVDALQGFLLQAMQQQQQQQAQQQQQHETQGSQSTQTQLAIQPPLSTEGTRQPTDEPHAPSEMQTSLSTHASELHIPPPPGPDLAMLLQLNSSYLTMQSPARLNRPASRAPWPMSPLGTLGLDSLLWAQTASPLAGDLGTGAWEGGLETPMRQYTLADFMSSPSPHRLAVSQVLGLGPGTMGESTAADHQSTAALLNSLQVLQRQQPQQGILSTEGSSMAGAKGGERPSVAVPPPSMPVPVMQPMAVNLNPMPELNTSTKDKGYSASGQAGRLAEQHSTGAQGSRRRRQQTSDSEASVDVTVSHNTGGIKSSRTTSRGGGGADSRTDRTVRTGARSAVVVDDDAPPLRSQNSVQGGSLGGIGTVSAAAILSPDHLVTLPTELRSCHCKKSQCLKLYCDCFAAGVYCATCSCTECYNRPEHAQKVMEKREHIIQRDPKAFTRKILSNDQQQQRHKKGCNCKRSHCLKKYCECYQGGVRCSDACKCLECHNQEERSGPPPPPPRASSRASSQHHTREPPSSPTSNITTRGRNAAAAAAAAQAACSVMALDQPLNTQALLTQEHSQGGSGSMGEGTEGEVKRKGKRGSGESLADTGAGSLPGLPWLQVAGLKSPWGSPDGLEGGMTVDKELSPQQRLAQVLDSCGFKGLPTADDLSTPPGVRQSQMKDASGGLQWDADRNRRDTPSTLRYPHSHVLDGGGGGGGLLRRYDSEPIGGGAAVTAAAATTKAAAMTLGVSQGQEAKDNINANNMPIKMEQDGADDSHMTHQTLMTGGHDMNGPPAHTSETTTGAGDQQVHEQHQPQPQQGDGIGACVGGLDACDTDQDTKQLLASPEDLPGDGDGDDGLQLHRAMEGSMAASWLHAADSLDTSTRMSSLSGIGALGHYLTTSGAVGLGLFGGPGSPATLSLNGLFQSAAGMGLGLDTLGRLSTGGGGGGDAGVGPMSPWQQDLFSLGSPAASSGGRLMGRLSSPGRLNGLLLEPAGSPAEPGGVHALVSPVRTGRKHQTVGLKRTFGVSQGEGKADAGHGAGVSSNIPMSPALDALASVAAAERLGANLLSGSAPRDGILLLPQSPSKRSALGSGAMPVRPQAASRPPSLPPLSSRMPQYMMQHQQSGDTAGEGGIRKHQPGQAQQQQQQQQCMSAGGGGGGGGGLQSTNSQSSVGSPGGAGGGNATGSVGASINPNFNPNGGSRTHEALKAQANDYIASRCRALAGSQPNMSAPPLSLPPLSTSALARSNSVPVPPPSHPIPGLPCRPSSLTSSSTTGPAPLSGTTTTGTTNNTTTATTIAGLSSGQHAIGAGATEATGRTGTLNTATNPSGDAGRTSVSGDDLHRGAGGAGSTDITTHVDDDDRTKDTDDHVVEADVAMDASQCIPGTATLALLCGTPWADGADMGFSDQFLMSPLAGWDPNLLLMSPRVTTPLYSAKGGASLNSPLYALSPTRWWPGSAGGAGNGLPAAGLGPLHPALLSALPLNTGGVNGGGPLTGASPARAALGMVSPARTSVAGGEVHSQLAASQLLRMAPGTTVLTSTSSPQQPSRPRIQSSPPQPQQQPSVLGGMTRPSV